MSASQSSVEGLAGAGVLDGHRLNRAVAADLADLRRRADADAALALEPSRLVHRSLERAEAVAAMDERDRQVGRVLEPERPVERRVAAADDDAVLALEDVLARDEVVEPAALPVVDPLELELPRLEGAVAGGHDQRPREELLARLRRQSEELLAVLRDAREIGDLFVEMDVGAELEPLLDAEVDEILAPDLRVAGDVVDVLLGIDRGDLAAELAEALDDANGRVAMARVVGGREADRACADDGDVADSFAHACLDATRGEENASASSRSRNRRPHAPARPRPRPRLPSPGRTSRTRTPPARSGC